MFFHARSGLFCYSVPWLILRYQSFRILFNNKNGKAAPYYSSARALDLESLEQRVRNLHGMLILLHIGPGSGGGGRGTWRSRHRKSVYDIVFNLGWRLENEVCFTFQGRNISISGRDAREYTNKRRMHANAAEYTKTWNMGISSVGVERLYIPRKSEKLLLKTVVLFERSKVSETDENKKKHL